MWSTHKMTETVLVEFLNKHKVKPEGVLLLGSEDAFGEYYDRYKVYKVLVYREETKRSKKDN